MASAITSYLERVLYQNGRAQAESRGRVWLPDAVRVALQQGCCAICALRLVAVSRPLLYYVPPSVLHDALILLVTNAAPSSCSDTLPGFNIKTCVACLGLLQGDVLLRMPSPGVAELENMSAAQCVVRWGVTTPPQSLVPATLQPQRVANWVDRITAAVAHSGFDLSGGVSVSISSECRRARWRNRLISLRSNLSSQCSSSHNRYS